MPGDTPNEVLDRAKIYVPDRTRKNVELQVIVCGLPRSGTTSLSQALHELGFGPIHHFKSLIFDAELSQSWKKTLEAHEAGRAITKEEWDALFHGFSSSVGVPAAHFADELARIYPGVKVIVNERDFQSWYRSCCDTIFTVSTLPRKDWFWRFFVPGSWTKATMVANHSRMFGNSHVLASSNPEAEAAKLYESHYTRMRRNIPSHQRLDWNFGDGWETLCSFLEVPIPQDKPFPHAWKTAEFRAKFLKGNAVLRSLAQKNILWALRLGATVIAITGTLGWLVRARGSLLGSLLRSRETR